MFENNEYVANYPTWRNNDMSYWNASGEYNNINSKNIIETYANQPFEGNSDELTYQNYLYSIVVDYYIHKDGLKHLKKSNSALLRGIKNMGDEIKGLEYSNGKENDIFSKFTVSVFDATSYESEAQPRLRMKCLVNNAAIVRDINFMYMDPADVSFRKYNVEVDAFKDIKFIFDTDKMRI